MSNSSTKRSRPPGAGRKPGGPNGEVRERPVLFKLAATEEQRLHQLLAREGLPTTNVGVRDLLLRLVDAESGRAAA